MPSELGLALPQLVGYTVSGTISLPFSGNFSPFLHSTSSLSVAREYLALGGGPPRFLQVRLSRSTREKYSGSQIPFAHGTVTLSGRSIPETLS